MRQKMLDHRVRADCVQCHKLMDPIGFALENFDGIGLVAHAATKARRSIATDEVFDGTKVDGPAGCASGSRATRTSSSQVVAEKLLTYGLGPRRRVSGHAARRVDRARRRARRQPVLVAGPRRRQSKPFQMNMKTRTRAVPSTVERPSAGKASDKGSQLAMFITKKHIPRRTFLKGAGCHAGAAAARRDGAGVDGAGADAPRRRSRASSASSSRTAWRRATGSRRPEGALPAKLPYILESLEKRQGPDRRPERSLVEVGRAARRDDRIRSLGRGGVPHRHQAAEDGRFRRDGRQPDDRSDIAQKIGQETLLPSLQLAVEDPNSSSSNCGEGYSCSYTNSISWIELPTPPKENGPRTSPLPMELNPQVVFERLFGSGSTPEMRAAAHEAEPAASSTRSAASWPSLHEGARRGRRAGRSTSTPTRSARSSGASSSRRRRRRRAGARPAARHPGAVRRAHQAALRPGRARVPGRHHARGDAARRPRPHRPQLPFPKSELFPERRHQRRASTADRTTRTIRCRSGATPTSTATTCRRWRISPRS